jgi:hypothetical protein
MARRTSTCIPALCTACCSLRFRHAFVCAGCLVVVDILIWRRLCFGPFEWVSYKSCEGDEKRETKDLMPNHDSGSRVDTYSSTGERGGGSSSSVMTASLKIIYCSRRSKVRLYNSVKPLRRPLFNPCGGWWRHDSFLSRTTTDTTKQTNQRAGSVPTAEPCNLIL